MRFSTSKRLHINDHLKVHLGYKSCPRTIGTEDQVYGGTRTHDLVVESTVPWPLGHPPLPTQPCLVWGEGTMPKGICNAKVVTLYKNKGDCSVLWAKALPESSWSAYRFWWLASTQSHSVVSWLTGPPWAWCSLYDNCRRNVVNRTSPYTSPS